MSMTSETGPNEVYCIECGEVIKSKAEICPECGVRQPIQPEAGHADPADAHQAGSPQTAQESYGFLFSFIDAWKRQNAIRHLLNIVLIFASFGTYIGILLIEAFFNYRKLNTGESKPYNGEPDQQVWLISP